MVDPLSEYLARLQAAGVPFRVRPDVVREIDHDGALIPQVASPREVRIGDEVVREHFDRTGGFAADHATLSVGAALLRVPDDVFRGSIAVDVGCGTGVLATLMARRGAHVVATDVREAILDLARRTAHDNGIAIDLRCGSLIEPIAPEESVRCFVANLPHKPGLRGAGLLLSQAGGEEGDSLFSSAIPEMARRQGPDDLLVFFLHSLPHPRLLLQASRWYDLEVVSWKLRWFQDGEYGALHDVFRSRNEGGRSYLHREGDREALVACVWWGRRRAEARS